MMWLCCVCVLKNAGNLCFVSELRASYTFSCISCPANLQRKKALTVSVFLIAAGSAVLHDGRDFCMKNVLDRNIYLIYFN